MKIKVATVKETGERGIVTAKFEKTLFVILERPHPDGKGVYAGEVCLLKDEVEVVEKELPV